MRREGYYDSLGEGRIHYCIWEPEGSLRAVLQIVHGMAETVDRYDRFAAFLNELGFLVAAEEHMGHGKSVSTCQGYFKGGWMCVADDCMTLFKMVKKKYPQVPYAFLGHSMGSFLVRTILCRYPHEDYQAVVLSGTGWQPRAGLPHMETLCKAVCRKEGETSPSPFLNALIFGSYNLKVEHKRTRFDWLTRDAAVVNTYIRDPDCGFPMTAGLFRDLMQGLQYIEDPDNLAKMKKDRPVFLVSGSMDPVGNYGKGVERTRREFEKAGLQNVKKKIYPLDRHEILNELNRQEVYGDISRWLLDQLFERN